MEGGESMQDLEKLEQELRRKGKAEGIRALAESADGQRLGQMIDGGAVERAVKSGDSAALRSLLARVLSTDEGRRLAGEIRRVMED